MRRATERGRERLAAVKAEVLGDGRCRLTIPADNDPQLETWAFAPGSVVTCKQLDLGDGPVLVAVQGDAATRR